MRTIKGNYKNGVNDQYFEFKMADVQKYYKRFQKL